MEAVRASVDVVLLTLVQGGLQAVLVRRTQEPFAGVWALPSGEIAVEHDAHTRDTALRLLREQAAVEHAYVEQLATFSGPARDPRGWSIAVAYCALVPPEALDLDSPLLRCTPIADLPLLPLDQGSIVKVALQRVRNKSQYSSLPAHLCGATFTLPQLQQVYESILGEPLNKVSFRRKMDEMNWLEPVPGALQSGGAHRPAQLYRVRPAFRLELALSTRGL